MSRSKDPHNSSLDKPYFDLRLRARKSRERRFYVKDTKFGLSKGGPGAKVASRRKMQQVTVKVRVVKHKLKGRNLVASAYGLVNHASSSPGSAAVVDHVKRALRRQLSYLAREGAIQEGLQDQPFITRDGSLSLAAASTKMGEWAPDRHSFHIIVSPGRGNDMDLPSFARFFISNMERDCGTRLDWLGSCHYNTDNYHIHFKIRGVDERGHVLFLPKEYVSHGLRFTAEKVATLMLGERRPEEIDLAEQKTLERRGFTPLDRDLIERSKANDYRIVTIESASHPTGSTAGKHRHNLLRRLSTLESLHLAKPINSQQWELVGDLEGRLRELQRSEKAHSRVLQHCKDPAWNGQTIVYSKDHLPEKAIQGFVMDKILDDELNEKWALILRDFAGAAHYVPLDPFSEAGFVRAKKGAVVTVSKALADRADQAISRFAQRHGGIFDLEAFRSQVEKDVAGGRQLPGGVSVQEYVASYRVRCETLTGFGVLSSDSNGKWNIPDDLAGRLVDFYEKSGQKPRAFIKVDAESHLALSKQINHSGPTWLDELLESQLQTGKVPSHITAYPLNGIEQALRERREALKKMGVPLTVGFTSRLRAGAMLEIHRDMVAKYGPAATPPDGELVEGRVAEPRIIGRDVYAIVSTDKGPLSG